MKPHYFEQAMPDKDDYMLGMSVLQGYVPPTCLLGGIVVMATLRGIGLPLPKRTKSGHRPSSSPTPSPPLSFRRGLSW